MHIRKSKFVITSLARRYQARVWVILLALLLVAMPLLGEWKPGEAPNQPIGEGKGIFPGRVVWLHDPHVTRWDGKTGAWYSDKNTDPALADAMVSRSIRLLAGAKTDPEAWGALFKHFNKVHARGEAGYKSGEKIIIKLNLNSGECYNTPQVTIALVRQLVKQAGVAAQDITLYDASRGFSEDLYKPIHGEFPRVRFEDSGGGAGRQKAQPDKKVALHFADPTIQDNGATYLPTCVTEATYMINLALLKGHDLAGVTLCAKNHFGSVYRDRDAKAGNKGWSPGNLHEAVMVAKRPMGSYNPLVELMGHKDLGGKTILYFIDALYAAPRQSSAPAKWASAPFNGNWTASVLVAQDPVAIESVAVDFFAAETAVAGTGSEADRILRKNVAGAVDNYLHEAATANQPPSGAKYDPEGDGTVLESLGVHEHWNNAAKKQYSRNLGTGKGIELITAESKD